jgi:hypothetical protein
MKELNLKKINLNAPDMYYKGNKTIYSGSERSLESCQLIYASR